MMLLGFAGLGFCVLTPQVKACIERGLINACGISERPPLRWSLHFALSATTAACLFVALFGRGVRAARCPLVGVERISIRNAATSESDPSLTFASSILPTAIGRGTIDRFSSCGLGLSPCRSGSSCGLSTARRLLRSIHTRTILQLDINLVT